MTNYDIRLWSLPSQREMRALHRVCFPDDRMWPIEGTLWWCATPRDDPEMRIGFAGMTVQDYDLGIAYLCRCGVHPNHRGFGLQKQFLHTRERKARDLHMTRLVTHTVTDNAVSSNNLIQAGYTTFDGPKGWADPRVIFWQKELT